MYAKLSSTITRSSIWRETPATRCVWITLLAVANKDGFVKGVEAWLASEANVTREECREALRCFTEPDPESQDQDYGGRRIDRQEGGWMVLNYPKYRAMRTQEQVLASERQQRKRLQDKQIGGGAGAAVPDVTPCHAPSRSVTAIVSASAPAPASEQGSTARARDDLAAEFAHEAHRDAYAAMRKAHRAPAIFDASLRTVHAPPTGGQGFPWDTIGAGLVELAGNGESFNVSRLRGYCRSHAAGPPDSGRRGAPTPPLAGTADVVQVGPQRLSAPEIWQRCVDVGLTSPMLSRDTMREAVDRLVERGAVVDGEAFLGLVLELEPATLAEIKFAKTREERLRERLGAWASKHAGRAA